MSKRLKKALALVVFSVMTTTAAVASTSLQISGTPGPRNANCSTTCIMTFRGGDVLKTVVIDEEGNVAAVVRTPLSDSAKLVQNGNGQSPDNSSGPSPLPVTKATAVSKSLPISGKPGPGNAACSSECFKTFRSRDVLKTVVLDSNGDVFEIVRTSLPDAATLVSTAGKAGRRTNRADADYVENFTYPVQTEGTGNGSPIGYGVRYVFFESYKTKTSSGLITTKLAYKGCSPKQGNDGACASGTLESVDVEKTSAS